MLFGYSTHPWLLYKDLEHRLKGPPLGPVLVRAPTNLSCASDCKPHIKMLNSSAKHLKLLLNTCDSRDTKSSTVSFPLHQSIFDQSAPKASTSEFPLSQRLLIRKSSQLLRTMKTIYTVCAQEHNKMFSLQPAV